MHEIIDDELANYQPTHAAYADETNHNIGRYRGVAVVTLSISDVERANQELQRVLEESCIKEFKWSKLRSAKSRFAALKLVDYVVDWAVNKVVRVDALTWDIEDSRHKIPNRSDTRNLRRMYYFLFRNVLGRRWPESCIWELLPDESSFQASSHLRYLGNPDEWNEDARRARISQIIEVKSHQEPLVQVADFFAGMAVYSRNSFYAFEQWNQIGAELQESLVKAERAVLSIADKERCQVLGYLYKRCKEHKLGVSLTSTRGLRTRDPRRPLNFWWYEPQGSYDRAPLW